MKQKRVNCISLENLTEIIGLGYPTIEKVLEDDAILGAEKLSWGGTSEHIE